MSGNPHTGVDGQGGTLAFDAYTARGDLAFSPWAESLYVSSIGQLNLAFVPLVKADTFYSGSTVNISRAQFQYHYRWFSGQATSYLANKFHLTANQPSAVSSVSYDSFRYIDNVTTQAASVTNQSLKSVTSVPNLAIKSVQNPPNSTATRTMNPTVFPTKTSTTSTPNLTPNNSLPPSLPPPTP